MVFLFNFQGFLPVRSSTTKNRINLVLQLVQNKNKKKGTELLIGPCRPAGNQSGGGGLGAALGSLKNSRLDGDEDETDDEEIGNAQGDADPVAIGPARRRLLLGGVDAEEGPFLGIRTFCPTRKRRSRTDFTSSWIESLEDRIWPVSKTAPPNHRGQL